MQRIFVGDVQGCADELEELIGRAERAYGADYELWLVGDLINRGPASRRVLERIRGLWERGRAHPVLGNHELSLLRVAFGLREPGPDDTFRELLGAPDAREWLHWLLHWPLVLRGEIAGQPFAMVHASVAPGWDLDELGQRAHRLERRLRAAEDEAARLLAADPRRDPAAADLARLTRCRSVDGSGAWSSAEPGFEKRPTPPGSPTRRAWHRAWAERGHRYGVVYGHWSLQGLHVAPNLRGLDTGCVYHGLGRDGFLSAWLPDANTPRPFAVPDSRFWRVKACRRYWSRPPG